MSMLNHIKAMHTVVQHLRAKPAFSASIRYIEVEGRKNMKYEMKNVIHYAQLRLQKLPILIKNELIIKLA